MRLSRIPLSLALAAGVSVAVVAALTAPSGTAGAAAPAVIEAPAAEVDVAPVLARSITDWQAYSGRLEAVDRVEVRPEVSGRIVQVHFRNGALVEKGEPLFTIDPRPYEAAVARAEAELARARSRVTFARADLDRAEKLAPNGTIPVRTLDEKRNLSREADAAVQAAQAELSMARLNLEHTRVVAPVSGRISRAEVTVGNVVSAGPGAQPLTTLVSVSPIYAAFDVDEQTYLRHIAAAKDKAGVPVRLGLADEPGYSRTGVVEDVDNRLDPQSGTIRVRARIDNPDGALVPGLYARIQVGGTSAYEALLVPDAAIGTDQNRKFVLALTPDNRVEYRPVTLGALNEGLRVITSGLSKGDRIVVNGLQRARPGDAVRPNPVTVEASAAGALLRSAAR
ncbi:MAG TPA: efflux RND transporter periplasmic adaptor subunit [Azospirillaceae bacterium]|nr:efflux RND transporter periplasmic adaptor subunit [Azospirillaceae bacterium]